MTETIANSSTFPLFSSLPPEIRNQIWEEALFPQFGPALYLYTKGCWTARRLAESEEGYLASDEDNLVLEYLPTLLPVAKFDIPMVSVNREASSVALAWARDHGIERRACEDEQSSVFTLPFDPAHDAVYVPLDRWVDFLCEPVDRGFEPDTIERIHEMRPWLTRLAIPEAVIRADMSNLYEIFLHYNWVQELYIVIDPQPDLLSTDDGTRAQHRWEFRRTRTGGFVWDHENRRFDFSKGEKPVENAIYKLMEDTCNAIREQLVEELVRKFEVRPALATRR